MPSVVSSTQVTSTADSDRGSATIQIAYELHGCDPRQLSHDDQIIALDKAANYGREEFVDTVIALLSLDLRAPACRAWDHLN